MTDQPTSGKDDRQQGEQPPSYPQQHDTGSTAPGYGSQPEYGHFQDRAYGHGSPEDGPPASPYGPPHGQPAQQYGMPAPGGPSYNAYGPPGQRYAPPGQGGTGFNGYVQPGYYGVPPEPKILSVASLCCGIAALVGFGFFLLPQIAAVILGHMALTREPSGRGMAIAGLVLGYVGVALTILVIVILGLLFSTARYSGYSV